MKKKPKTEENSNEDVYDSENVEEMLDDDEMTSGEAGFMEGFNEKQRIKPKKIKHVLNEK